MSRYLTTAATPKDVAAMLDTELAGLTQPPQASEWAQAEARRILPVLDGSKLETMRKREIAAAIRAGKP